MKTAFRIAFCLFLISFIALVTQAQSVNDIALAESLFVPKVKVDYKEFVRVNKNEIESTFSVLFMGYKNYISSQDIDACVFEPSCSVYAIECIHHEKNKLIAFLKISDRLTRCHPLVSKGTYKIDVKTGKFIDPIEN
jgi:putative component of membrane protein insertase Oxa1/YidC/SpoIIIJ protein YidD